MKPLATSIAAVFVTSCKLNVAVSALSLSIASCKVADGFPRLFQGGTHSAVLGQRALGRLEQFFPFLCINSLSLLARRISAFDISPFDMYLVPGTDEPSFENWR